MALTALSLILIGCGKKDPWEDARKGVTLAPAELKFSPPKGYACEEHSVLEQSMDGVPQIKQEVWMQNRYSPGDSAGTFVLSCQPTRFRTEQVGDVYDSREPPKEGGSGGAVAPSKGPAQAKLPAMGEVMHQMLEPVLGRTFTFRLDTLGRVQRVDGLSEALEAGINNIKDPRAADPMKAMFLTSRNANTGNFLRMPISPLPGKKVAANESWEREEEAVLPMLGTANCRTRYTYLGTVSRGGEKCAKMVGIGEVKGESTQQITIAGRVFRVSQSDTAIRTTAYFRLASHTWASIETKTEVSLGLSADGATKQTRLTRVTLLEAKPLAKEAAEEPQ